MNLIENQPGQDLDAEEKWHEQKFYIDSGHWSSHPVFASRERHWLFYDVAKIRFFGALASYLKGKTYWSRARTLLAPAGDGGDARYLQGIADEVHGVDISSLSLTKCPRWIVTRKADILNSGYEDESFDIVVCALFLHHVHEIGFEPFLAEFQRVLKKGGVLAILEPGSLYPVNVFTGYLTRFLGNVTGKVEGERPVYPPSVSDALEKIGFTRRRVVGLSFNHCRFPFVLQSFVNALDLPFRRIWPLNLLACDIGWFCEKA